VLQRRLPDLDAIDEVLQEVAVAMTVSTSVPMHAIQPWLCRIAIRQASLYRRRRGRQRRLQDAFANSGAADVQRHQADDPLVWMLAEERRQFLQSAFGCLASADRNILTMKYVDGHGYQHIARKLDITVHAVANRLRTARDRLRKAVEQFATDVTDEIHHKTTESNQQDGAQS